MTCRRGWRLTDVVNGRCPECGHHVMQHTEENFPDLGMAWGSCIICAVADALESRRRDSGVDVIGRWLCRRNRHKRSFRVDPGMTKDAKAIARAFDVPEVIVCPVVECGRCGAPLGLRTKRLLGWESFGAW
jgi:hypothetical protein